MTRHIGHYEVVAELGRGGMGVVYKAREESLQRFVAIKMLGNQLVDNESVAARFMREARAVADLNHPNLVQVFGVDRHEDQPYFVMEYVEGEPLKTLIRRERQMQPMRALQILKEVAEGLAAVHDKGVVHRDIKPENIMLTRYGGVKVVDFGIARVDEPGTRLTTTGIGLGTPSYLSPEVCLSQDVDQRSDIFSLGVVLFEMLTGDTPFKSDSPFELMTKVVEAKIPDIKALNPNVDEGVKRILAKMIAKRPKLRYHNCNELISDIEDYQAGRVPRWARDMPVSVASGESDGPDLPPDDVGDEETEGPAVIDDSSGAAEAIAVAAGTSDSAGPGEAAQTLAVAESAPHRNRRGRLAWAAVLVLLAGGAVAGSWHLLGDGEWQMPWLAGSQPETPAGRDRTATDADEAVRLADSGETGTGVEASAPVGGADPVTDDSGANAPGRAAETTETDPVATMGDAGSPTAEAGTPQVARTGPADAPAQTVDSAAADDGGGSGGDGGFEIAVTGERPGRGPADTRSEPEQADPAPWGEVGAPESGAPESGGYGRAGESSGDSLAPAAAVEAESRAMPAAPRVAVVAVGDEAVTATVAGVLKRGLNRARFEVVDEQLIDGLVYAESLAGVVRTVRNHGADALVYADVVRAGERELVYYGRREPQYLATLEVRVIDLHKQRNLGPPVAEKLEYVALNADDRARETAIPIARNVVNRLRALRAMRTDGQSD